MFILAIAISYSVFTNFFQDKNKGNELSAEKQIQSSTTMEEEQPIIDGQADSIMNGYLEIEEELAESSDFELGYDEHGHSEQQPEIRELSIPAPDFKLTTLTGETVKLSDYRGKKVFINFWATWCPPCKEEMPHIQQYYEKSAKDDVVILAINEDSKGNRDAIQQFVNEYSLSFPILLDETGDVSITYEILTLPTSMIINEEGVVVEQIIGPVTEEMLHEKLGN